MEITESKILLIGARGMLGTDLATALKDVGELVLWDKEEIDITNSNEVGEKVSSLVPDIIINATGYTNVDGAEENLETALAVNTKGVEYLVEVAKSLNTKIVHFSTEYVFDGNDKNGYSEDSFPNPLNNYGKSKKEGEEYITDYSKGYLVRSSWLYGHALQKGKPRGLNFIDTIIQYAQERPVVQVVNDQYGKLTNTQDLATAVYELLSANYKPGVYHLVNEGVASWYEVAQEVWQLKNITKPLLPVSSEFFSTKAARPRYGVLLNTKFAPLRHWREALKDYLLS